MRGHEAHAGLAFPTGSPRPFGHFVDLFATAKRVDTTRRPPRRHGL